ncbi:MAG: DUF1015 domain-containing protein [Actinomycetales bacterium]|nr:DUF1015 domain-containing protein [Actinomycetales bacterium]
MATLRPFRALRPPRDAVAAVAAPPYDVVDTAEARALAAGNPDSFLHVSRPEIDLPDDVDPHADVVHAAGRRALDDLVARGVLVRDAEPGLLVYRQRMRLPAGAGTAERTVTQTGVVGCATVADYRAGVIATHEHTRHDKETDRTRHIAALAAHDEPVFLMYRPEAPGAATIAATVAQVTARAPEYDLVTDDGVAHTLWTVDPAERDALVAAFGEVPRLYVADGHHRSAAAARVAEEGRHGPGAGEFPVVVFPADELTVLPYHRAVADLAGRTLAGLRDALADAFDVVPAHDAPEPGRHQVGLYADGGWWLLRARDGVVDEADPIARLDVSVLQDRVLGPLLGVADPRTDPRIRFVGGIRGAAALERLVDAGEAAAAFALHPTSADEVMDVADGGRVMPPKSTWFEPKLRSGLFVHPID